MADNNDKTFVDKCKDAACDMKDSIKQGFDNLTGNETASSQEDDKFRGPTMMDKGYWDNKGMYYQGPNQDQKLHPG